jgi:transcriptional regulator with XRE-family HTH domain
MERFMPRPSDPLLAWLRTHLERKRLNTARLAESAGIERARLRKILAGTEPMLVDELLGISRALDLSPSDLAGADIPEVIPGAEARPLRVAEDDEDVGPKVDPWGNQPEQLFRIAFGLGCDFFFLSEAAQLEKSGIPESVLTQYRGRDLPVKLDAAYHQYNQPRYDPVAVTLTLSFDALYDCRFPWSAIKQVIFYPVPPEPEPTEEIEEEKPKGAPHLRLVT